MCQDLEKPFLHWLEAAASVDPHRAFFAPAQDKIPLLLKKDLDVGCRDEPHKICQKHKSGHTN